MSLLPNRFQINDEMPTLGQLVREAIQPEPCKIERFNKGNHGIIPAPGVSPTAGYIVTEADCRQIKGAAKSEEKESLRADFATLADAWAVPQGSALIGFKGAVEALGEWRDCSEDMPDLPAGKYELRGKLSGKKYPNTASALPLIIGARVPYAEDLQYRKLP